MFFRFGASKIERIVSVTDSTSKFKEGGVGVKGPNLPVTPKVEVKQRKEAKEEIRTKRENLVVNGKLNDKGGIVSESLIYEKFIPIWRLFQPDKRSKELQDSKQENARNVLLTILKETWKSIKDEPVFVSVLKKPKYVSWFICEFF